MKKLSIGYIFVVYVTMNPPICNFLWWNVMFNPCFLSSLNLCPLNCDLLFSGWLCTQSTFLVYCPLLLTILMFNAHIYKDGHFHASLVYFSLFQMFEFVVVKLQCWAISTNLNKPLNGYQGNFLNSYYDSHKNQITSLNIFHNVQIFEKIKYLAIKPLINLYQIFIMIVEII